MGSTDDGPYAKDYYYKLEDSKGYALTGPGYSVEEHILPNVGITSNGEFVDLANGVAMDVVGWPDGPPSKTRDTVTTQTFTVKYNGKDFDLTTVFRHENLYFYGATTATNTVTVIKP